VAANFLRSFLASAAAALFANSQLDSFLFFFFWSSGS
jgi:hypothetical protein